MRKDCGPRPRLADGPDHVKARLRGVWTNPGARLKRPPGRVLTRRLPPRLLKAEPVALGAEVLVFVGPEGSPREVVGVVRALRMYQGHMVVRIHSDDDTAHDLWFGRYRLR